MDRLSFCTVCMNRVHHLKQTLPKNIEDSGAGNDVDFVLLDYNSVDGLEEFVKTELSEHIRSGKLNYFKTTSPAFFNRSHSRNLAFKLAEGEIVCNVDADNFIGEGFAAFIRDEFRKDRAIFISAGDLNGAKAQSDVLGRIAVRKSDFLSIGGFDERMVYYGFEDYDLINRLSLSGLKNVIIKDRSFVNAIRHGTADRLKNEFVSTSFAELYIRYIDAAHSEILLLFNMNEFKRATMQSRIALNAHRITNRLNSRFEYGLMEDAWESGTWKKEAASLQLHDTGKGEQAELWVVDEPVIRNPLNEQLFHHIKTPKIIQDVLFFYSQVTNRLIMESNMKHRVAVVNQNGFGKDRVFRNFDINHPLVYN